MDAARPALEPLPDLPVEEPVDAAVARPAPAPAVAPAPADAAPASTAARPAEGAPADEATGTLTMLKPEMLIAADGAQAPSPAPAAPPPEEAPQVLEEIDPAAPLSLEEPQVEKMLTTPSAIPAPPVVVPTLAPAVPELTLSDEFPRPAPAAATPAPVPPAAPAKPAPEQEAAQSATLVPLARRASLSAAAQKLAAASAAGPRPATKPRPVAPAPAPSAPVPAPGSTSALAPASSAPPARIPTAKAQTAAKPPSPAPAAAAAEAPSLAAWANARAAAAPPAAKPAAAPAVKSAAAAPAKATAPAKPNGATAAPAAAATTPAAPAMDRDFIARNQVVERYLSGRLPIKAATDFERYCKGHPALLDEIGLPDRVNAGLRLLEAAGKPEPWQEPPRGFWQRPGVTLGLAAATVVLVICLSLVGALSASKTRKIADLLGQVHDRPLDPATSTRTVRLLPSRTGASNSPAITIGGGAEAQLIDFRIDETRSPYRDFRITIDRTDQGRVMVIDNLTKDSNGHLRLELNTSALGPGNYQLTIEGLTMRLEPQPDSWVTIGVAARPVQQ